MIRTNNRPVAMLVVLVAICAFSFPLHAQTAATLPPVSLYLPDFFYKTTTPRGDTSFAYEYLDKKEKTISIYDVADADQVGFVKYHKVFRMQMPSGSNVSAPTQYMMVYEYVHPTKDRWVRYDREIGEMLRYKSYKDQIVGADTVTMTDPVTKAVRPYIFKYYKTEITERTITAPEEHGHEH